jgi:hypothetical protein
LSVAAAAQKLFRNAAREILAGLRGAAATSRGAAIFAPMSQASIDQVWQNHTSSRHN